MTDANPYEETKAAVEGTGEGTAAPAKKPRRGRPPKRRAPANTEPKARRSPTGPKQDLTEGATLVWGGIGSLMIRLGDPPVGRVMQFQAPDAGRRINKLVRQNELLYRFLAPILGKGQLATELAPLLLPPLLVGAIERNPALAPTLGPLLQSQMIEVAKSVARDAARSKEQLAAIGDADEEVNVDLEEIMATIFGWDEEPSSAGVAAPSSEAVPPGATEPGYTPRHADGSDDEAAMARQAEAAMGPTIDDPDSLGDVNGWTPFPSAGPETSAADVIDETIP